jgi:AraC-like DNA-binding protein
LLLELGESLFEFLTNTMKLKLQSERILHPDQSFRFLHGDLSADKLIWHYHPQWELTWIESGSGIRFVGDNVSPYLDGEMVLLGADLPHLWKLRPSYTNEKTTPLLKKVLATVIQFPSSMLEDKHFPEMRAMQSVMAQAEHGLVIQGHSRTAIQEKLLRMRHASPLTRLSSLMAIFSDLAAPDADLQTIASSSAITKAKTDQRKRIDQVLSWAQANLNAKLDIESAANIACISPAAFSRFFKRETGKTFTQYVIELRCSTACLKLFNNDTPIALIAEECGFATLSNFNRIFRDYAKKTPRDYRKSIIRV